MLRLVLACLLALGLVIAPAAGAASTTQILRDCADDGVLQGHYSPSDLRNARNNIPTDTDEYTDCRDVLARAAADAIAGSSAPGGPGGSGGPAGSAGSGGSRSGGLAGAGAAGAGPVDTNTQEARDAVAAAAAKGRPGPLQVGGRPVVPGAAGFATGAVRNGLPALLVAVLALLGAAALAAATPFARRRVLARFRR